MRDAYTGSPLSARRSLVLRVRISRYIRTRGRRVWAARTRKVRPTEVNAPRLVCEKDCERCRDVLTEAARSKQRPTEGRASSVSVGIRRRRTTHSRGMISPKGRFEEAFPGSMRESCSLRSVWSKRPPGSRCYIVRRRGGITGCVDCARHYVASGDGSAPFAQLGGGCPEGCAPADLVLAAIEAEIGVSG